jgi:hypothetical protein
MRSTQRGTAACAFLSIYLSIYPTLSKIIYPIDLLSSQLNVANLVLDFWCSLALNTHPPRGAPVTQVTHVRARGSLEPSLHANPQKPTQADGKRELDGPDATWAESQLAQFWARAQLNPDFACACEPYLTHVVSALLVRTQFPSEEVFASWDLEARDAFVEYRRDVRDALRLLLLRRPLSAGAELLAHVQQSLALHLASWEAQGVCGEVAGGTRLQKGPNDWQAAEALLHALSAVASGLAAATALGDVSVASGVQEGLVGVLSSLPRLPAFAPLQCTSVLLLSVLGDWLEAHPVQWPALIALLQRSLGFPEEHELWPFRSQSDHAGCVALMKLCSRPGLARLVVQSGGLQVKEAS